MIQVIGFGAYWHVLHGLESLTGRQDYHYHGLVIFGRVYITPFCLGSTYTGRGRAFSLWFFGARNITRVNLESVLHRLFWRQSWDDSGKGVCVIQGRFWTRVILRRYVGVCNTKEKMRLIGLTAGPGMGPVIHRLATRSPSEDTVFLIWRPGLGSILFRWGDGKVYCIT